MLIFGVVFNNDFFFLFTFELWRLFFSGICFFCQTKKNIQISLQGFKGSMEERSGKWKGSVSKRLFDLNWEQISNGCGEDSRENVIFFLLLSPSPSRLLIFELSQFCFSFLLHFSSLRNWLPNSLLFAGVTNKLGHRVTRRRLYFVKILVCSI